MFRFVSFFPILSGFFCCFFFFNELGQGIESPVLLCISYFLWLLTVLSDYLVSILWHCFKVIPFGCLPVPPEPQPTLIHSAAAHTVCFGTLSAFLWAVQDSGKLGGVGGDCGLETNLCSFTMNQKRASLFPEICFLSELFYTAPYLQL